MFHGDTSGGWRVGEASVLSAALWFVYILGVQVSFS